jgi:hypothetical protein
MRSLLYSMNNLSLLLRARLVHSNSYYNEIGISILMNKNCNVIYIYIYIYIYRERERERER